MLPSKQHGDETSRTSESPERCDGWSRNIDSANQVNDKTTNCETYSPFTPFSCPPVQLIEFTKQPASLGSGRDGIEIDSHVDSPHANVSYPSPRNSTPGTHFRLMPRKPHLFDDTPASNPRGRKRSAQSMNSANVLSEKSPPSPLTNSMLGLHSLSLNSPSSRSGLSRSSPCSIRPSAFGSPATSFSKVEGSPFQSCSPMLTSSVQGRATAPQLTPDLSSSRIVPLTILSHADSSKVSASSQGGPPRSSASLLRSPFSFSSPRVAPMLGTPGSYSVGACASTDSINDTPLPKVSLTPRSTSSRRSRRAVPRFPSPSDEPTGPPPLPFATKPQDDPMQQLLSSSSAAGGEAFPFVSFDATPNRDRDAPADHQEGQLKNPPPISRSLLKPEVGPLDSFLIPKRSDHVDSESLSDEDDDDFLLAFPSTLIEEKQQHKTEALRQTKQPRTNSIFSADHPIMASAGSLSATSLLGVAFASSHGNLRDANNSSMNSFNNNCDIIVPSGLKREESCASIGLMLDVPTGVCELSTSRSDLVTPPAAPISSAIPPSLKHDAPHSKEHGSPEPTPSSLSFNLLPKRTPPTSA